MAVGFREDFSYLNTGLGEDPFKDLFLKEPFEYTEFNIPREEEAPPIIIPDTSGGEDRDTRTYYNTPTGRVYSNGEGTYTYDDKQAFAPGSIPSELAWGAYNLGRDMPDWAQAVVPGVQGAQFLGGLALDSQIDAIDTQYDRLTPPDLQPNNYNFNKKNQPQGIPASNLISVTDEAGNVRYVEKGSKEEKKLNEEALRNSLEYDLEKLGLKNLKDFSIKELQDIAIKTSSGLNDYDYPSYDSYNTAMNNLQAANTPDVNVQLAMDLAREQLASERGAGYGNYGGGKGQAGTAHAGNASDGDYGGGTGGQTAGDEAGDSWGSSPFSKGGYVGPLGNRR